MSHRGNPQQQRGRGAGGDRGGRGGYGPPRGASPDRGGPRGGAPFRGGPPGRGGGPPRGRGGFGGPPDGGIFQEGRPAVVAPRLAPANQDQLIKAFKAVKPQPERPLRPGFGTLGSPITLRTNFFALKVPKGPLYEYAVEIKPKTDINRLKARIFQLVEQSAVYQPHKGYLAHDASQRIISARKLPQPLIIAVPYYEEGETGPRAGGKQYQVSIVFQQELVMTELNQYLEGNPQYKGYDPLPLVSALNIVLQQHAAHNGVRVSKNRYFFLPAERMSLGIGMEAWRGFYTSVRPTYKQLMVNVNVCMTAFVQPGNLAEALGAFNRNSRGAMPTLPKDMVKNIKVTTKHLGYKRRYPLKAVLGTSARNTFFQGPEGRITVEQYFKKTYNITLKHPTDLPVVNVGSKAKASYIPAELCEIEPGQAFRGRLGDNETRSMLNLAVNPPKVNAEHIVGEGFHRMGLNPIVAPVDAFGLSLDLEMAVVPARELPAPQLSYRGARPLSASNGSWNLLQVKFQRGATIQARSGWWVLIVREERMELQGKTDPRLMGIVNAFTQKLKNCGMTVPDGLPRLLVTDVLPSVHRDPGRVQALNIIRNTLKGDLQVKGVKPGFVLVLLSQRDNYIYPGIKRIGDVELGLQTVHMLLMPNSSALNDAKLDQYLSNVALKVNTKLGGINHQLDENAMKWLTKKKTMMVGIDVTHPGPGSRDGTPSIAAVVASVDDSFVQYPASLRVQKSKKEMLDELADMMVERLKHYEKKNKMLPERIFVFRDGVSEGQYETVLQEELIQFLNAFRKLSAKKAYRPQLSIIICGKRHHARFFPVDSNHAARNGNTRPGTVVDKGVTGVFDFDFYLQAHAGLKGTVRPTHYTVVYDEAGLGADELQQGTHTSSYLYARATKSVSLIPAAYYADLACERGRCYLNDFLVDDGASSVGAAHLTKEQEEARVFAAAIQAWGQGLHDDVRESMFYI
ncbi:argonaute-like protein [Mycena floridula]|nr:argonaute-like protein [Mycena floridula]